ncbi:c-type cytochrome [Vibrio parahaemolyticus]|nr:c-type cytochrome [Vibrio parahaemolyticus]
MALGQERRNSDAKAAAQEALTQDLSMDELMAQGEAIYSARCAVCHQANGEGIPGRSLQLKAVLSRQVISPNISAWLLMAAQGRRCSLLLTNLVIKKLLR